MGLSRGAPSRATSTVHEPHHDLPERIRKLRRSRKLTLESVASKVGVTKGFLSQIEHGAKGPSIPTLLKIASALDAPISYFFNADPIETAAYSIVRSSERKSFQRSGSNWDYHFQALAFKKKHKAMEPLLSSPPHHFPPDPFVHSGEELLFVLKGRVKLELGGTHYILESGDCAYYDGSVPHRSCSMGKIRATVMLVISSESFNGSAIAAVER